MVVVEIDDKTSLEYAILENVQRADLNPIEEAEGYSRLMAEFSYTQENLSKIIGKSRSHIANMMRLTDLPVGRAQAADRAQDHRRPWPRAAVGEGSGPGGASAIVDEGMSVRQVEEIAQADNAMPAKAEAKAAKPAKTGEGPGHPRAREGAAGRARPHRQHRPQGQRRRIAHPATRPWSSSTACAGG